MDIVVGISGPRLDGACRASCPARPAFGIYARPATVMATSQSMGIQCDCT